MNDWSHPSRTSHINPGNSLNIAGCNVDLFLNDGFNTIQPSTETIRLAEDRIAEKISCSRHLIRVESLMPSGRPIVIVRGKVAGIYVSISHIKGLTGCAICTSNPVGLDIVDPADTGRSLDLWFTDAELSFLPDNDGLKRARLWGAKESAFKAAHLDEGFRPCAVKIRELGPSHFRWCLHGDHGDVYGQGSFTFKRPHLLAVAVATDYRDALHSSSTSCNDGTARSTGLALSTHR